MITMLFNKQYMYNLLISFTYGKNKQTGIIELSL